MKRHIFCILFSLLGLNTFSQTVITGKVTQEKGEPMPGASVYLQGTYDGTSTDENGQFILKTTKKGPFNLLAGFMGFEQVSRKVELKGDTLRLDIQLKEAFNQLDAVTITAGAFE